MAVGFLAIFTDQNFTLEHTARLIVQDTFIDFARATLWCRVVYKGRMVAMLTAFQKIAAKQTTLRVRAKDVNIDFVSR